MGQLLWLPGQRQGRRPRGCRRPAWNELQARLKRASQLNGELQQLEKKDIGAINHGLERLRLHARKLELDGKLDAAAQADMDADRAELNSRYKAIEDRLSGLHQAFARDSLVARDGNGREVEINLSKVVHAIQPNGMSGFTAGYLLCQGVGIPQR